MTSASATRQSDATRRLNALAHSRSPDLLLIPGFGQA
jgi:hypothetical protein